MTDGAALGDFRSRKVILGVSGGIAAYKTAFLIRLLKRAGAEVQVLMTTAATRFISPLTLGTLSEKPVLIEIFPENEEGSWTRHVHLGAWADLFVVAPATAQTIARLAQGHCETMLTAVALSARCPIIVCPSMDFDMFEHPATQRNLETLRSYGYIVVDPDSGPLASGLSGIGRLPEPEVIAGVMARVLRTKRPTGTLAGKRVLVTAGPTREALDPVRFLSNPSTGTMGFALARAAAQRGAEVVLVAGPTHLSTPPGVQRVDVETAAEMKAAVDREKDADIVFMAAAVADYRPVFRSDSKTKKSNETITIQFEPTEDILAGLGARRTPGQVLVGFAMETDDATEHARRKLERKRLDWIVLNNLREPGAGFGTGTNRVTLLHRSGTVEELPLLPKSELAEQLLDRMAADLPAPLQ